MTEGSVGVFLASCRGFHKLPKLIQRMVVKFAEIEIKRRGGEVVLARLLNDVHYLLQLLWIVQGVEMFVQQFE